MSLKLQHEVIKNPEGEIKYKIFRDGGREHYHIGLWIDADERTLDRIDYVEYELHSSFKRRKRHSRSRSNQFSITFWTWGHFDIDVRVHFRDRSTTKVVYPLRFELPADTGANYADVS